MLRTRFFALSAFDTFRSLSARFFIHLTVIIIGVPILIDTLAVHTGE